MRPDRIRDALRDARGARCEFAYDTFPPWLVLGMEVDAGDYAWRLTEKFKSPRGWAMASWERARRITPRPSFDITSAELAQGAQPGDVLTCCSGAESEDVLVLTVDPARGVLKVAEGEEAGRAALAMAIGGALLGAWS